MSQTNTADAVLLNVKIPREKQNVTKASLSFLQWQRRFFVFWGGGKDKNTI